jgi:hypothetical protein
MLSSMGVLGCATSLLLVAYGDMSWLGRDGSPIILDVSVN